MVEDKSNIFKSASFYGMLLGLFWAFKFILVMFGYNAPTILAAYLVISTFTLIITYNMTRAYKLFLGGKISFFHAWQFGVLLYMFAALIVSVMHYIFYAYVAPAGFIASTIDSFIDLLKSQNVDDSVIAQYEEMKYISPIKLVISQIMNNITLGMIFSIPIAFFASRKDDSELINRLKDIEKNTEE